MLLRKKAIKGGCSIHVTCMKCELDFKDSFAGKNLYYLALHTQKVKLEKLF